MLTSPDLNLTLAITSASSTALTIALFLTSTLTFYLTLVLTSVLTSVRISPLTFRLHSVLTSVLISGMTFYLTSVLILVLTSDLGPYFGPGWGDFQPQQEARNTVIVQCLRPWLRPEQVSPGVCCKRLCFYNTKGCEHEEKCCFF